MASRSIRPAPLRPEAGGPAASSDMPDTASVHYGQLDKITRIRNVIQACDDCRRAKTKCDGRRPKCRICIAKNRPCGYIGEKGQSRIAASKLRIEYLEKLFAVLQDSPPQQADQLLNRIRTTDSLLDALDRGGGAAVPRACPTVESSDSGEPSSTARRPSLASLDGSIETPPTECTARSSSSGDPATPSRSLSAGKNQRAAGNLNLGQDVTFGSRPSSAGDKVGLSPRSSRSPGQLPNLIQLLLPDPSVTDEAIEAFFRCAGRLFHVFSREQIRDCHHVLFDDLEAPSPNVKAKIGVVMAVSAVGAQYMPDTFSKQTETTYYQLARHFFDDVIEQDQIQAIKVCALLALYNILAKAMTALVYVDTGLGLARRVGLTSSAAPQAGSIPVADWVDARKSFRTLVFFSSWLSSTLGYMPGYELMSEREVVSHNLVFEQMYICDTRTVTADDFAKLTEMRHDNEEDLPEEVLQTEMAKICLLKADILRIQLTLPDLTAPTVESISRDLQNWYRQLPEVMRLEASGREDMSLDTKRSVLQLHLLYLGALMLLYRRLAAHALRVHETGVPGNALQMPLSGLLAERSGEAALAATSSARVLTLLKESDSIFKRCWLVIFQAYTSGTILLHVAIQKQLHGFDPSTWVVEQQYAHDCISVLAFCSSMDRVAAEFLAKLTPIYDKAFSAMGPSARTAEPSTTNGTGTLHVNGAAPNGTSGRYPVNAGYLFDFPPNADPALTNLAMTVLSMVGQPFGSAASPGGGTSQPPQAAEPCLGDPGLHEPAQQIKWPDWGLKNSIPFQWDLAKMHGSLSPEAVPRQAAVDPMSAGAEPKTSCVDATRTTYNYTNRFIGSSEPSQWTSAVYLTRKDDVVLNGANTQNGV